MVRRSNSKCAMIIISLIMIIAATQLLAATPERNGCGSSPAPGPASVLSRGYSGERTSQSPPVTLALAWGAETSVPETIARYAHAQDPDNPSSLYVICGVSNGSLVNHTWRYDVGPGTWTALANAPAALEAPDAAITGGKLYLLGGGTSNQMSIYDIATNTWSAGPALPRNVTYCAVGCHSGMIYMIGGDDDMTPSNGVSNVVNIFDIAANAWTGTGTPMPTATSAAGYFQIGSYLYIVGGWGSAHPTNVNAVQRYDMATDTWSTGPAIPNAPGDFTLVGNSQKLYALGGDNDGGGYWNSTTLVQNLDLSTWPAGSWVADTSLPYAVQAMNSGFCTPAAVGGTHWLVGGLEGATSTFHSEVYSTPAEACAPAGGSCTTVLDQPLSAINSAYVDQDFPDSPDSSSYLADDFTNSAPWTINEISIPGYGWGSFTTLMNATSLNWAIYADNAGIPAGYPGDGVTTPQWSLSLPPSDASIVLSNGTGGLPSNVDITLSAPPTIPAGTWWLIFWPVMSFGSDGQYGRQGSDTTNGYTTQFINPGGGFGFGTTWQSWAVLGATLQDMAFSICASTGGGCPTITILPATLPAATVGVAYSQTVTASGGTAPYTFEVTMGTLPPGLTLDPATGILSGTPTTGGSFTFTITATDSSACTGTITYTMDFSYGWNMSVVDDAGRASACLNTDTGYYAWTVLTGFGSGTYVGRSNVTFSNNTYYFQSGKPGGMNLKVSLATNKASGTYMTPPLREKSICIDNDITDSPACP